MNKHLRCQDSVFLAILSVVWWSAVAGLGEVLTKVAMVVLGWALGEGCLFLDMEKWLFMDMKQYRSVRFYIFILVTMKPFNKLLI
jgi:hypothetical protein